mmetsp:Transcript_31561/g.102849  ORF Transcript_31561/g.102849 Transcript_31561/m.102849 type:complete len:81 (+) Transcript_31561:355-597(+)
MFSKTEVNGPGAHPVWDFLKSARPPVVPAKKERDMVADGGDEITWNWAKFLVDRTGTPVKRYPPKWDQDQIVKDVEALLG